VAASDDSAGGSAGQSPAEPLHSGDNSAPEHTSRESGQAPDAGETEAAGLGETAGPDQTAGPPRGGWFRRARLGFRGWRRTRPFWGGLIALLGGIEILLSERAPVAVVVHLGAQGLAGYVVPVVLVLCALLLWFNPAQRIFYSILAVLAALASFITSNLGGFVLGMLLGIVGGSLAFAWVPGEPPRPRRRRREKPALGRPSEGLAIVVGDRERQAAAPHGEDPASGPAGDPEPGQPGGQAGHQRSRWGERPRGSSMVLAVLPAPLVLAVVASLPHLLPAAGPLTPGPAAPMAGRAPAVSASPSPSTGTVSPSPAPSGSPAPTATPSPSPTVSPSATTPAPAPSPTPSTVHKKAASPSLLASGSQSSITAGTVLMTGLSYDGVADVQTATGTVPMLVFSMSSMTLSGGTVLTVSENGHAYVTNDSSLDFRGNVVLYTTRISGRLLGATVTFTPQAPPPLVLPTMTFTDVVTDQPLTRANSFQAADLLLRAS
jgi:hypothetical protein